MSQSITDLLKLAEAEAQKTPIRKPDTWQLICQCGHPQRFHSPDIGGTYGPLNDFFAEKRKSRTKRVLETCCGQPIARGHVKEVTHRVGPDPDNEGYTLLIEERVSTCACAQFHAVLRVNGAAGYFNQRRPRSQLPTDHPVLKGVQAYRTWLRNKYRPVADARKAGKSEPEIEKMVAGELDRRIEYLETWQCAIDGCGSTTVLPYYVRDQTELRCLDHRP